MVKWWRVVGFWFLVGVPADVQAQTQPQTTDARLRAQRPLRRMRAQGGTWILDRTWYEDAEVFAHGLYERGLMSRIEHDLCLHPGNAIGVGDTWGGTVAVDGGSVGNSTQLSVSANGGTAKVSASGFDAMNGALTAM